MVQRPTFRRPAIRRPAIRRPAGFALPGPLTRLSGGTRYDLRVIEGLQALGHAVNTVVLADTFPRPSKPDLKAARSLLCQSRQQGSALIIDGLAYGVLEPDLIAAIPGPIIALVHHPLALETGLSPDLAARLRHCEITALRHADVIATTSTLTAATLAAEFDVSPSRIIVAEPGVDHTRTTHAPAAQRERETGSPVNFLTIGSLTPRKGHDSLARALAALPADIGPWHWHLAGDATADPATAATLRALINELQIAERTTVHDAPSDEELDDLRATADIFALASRYEGFGMVFAEAMACGLPVLACRAGAVPSVVPASAGLLSDVDDVPALTAAAANLIADAALRQRLAMGARARSAALLTWEDTAAVWSAIIDGI